MGEEGHTRPEQKRPSLAVNLINALWSSSAVRPDRHGPRGTPRTVERGEATESGTDRRFQKKLGTGPGWASHGRGVVEVVMVVWVVLAWRWDTTVAGATVQSSASGRVSEHEPKVTFFCKLQKPHHEEAPRKRYKNALAKSLPRGERRNLPCAGSRLSKLGPFLLGLA